MSDALKTCPFCGGDASFKPRSFKASCDKCGAHIPNGSTTSGEAITAWNTRAAPKVKELVWPPSTAQSPFGLYRLEYGEESPYRFMARATLDEVPVSEWFLESDDEDYAWKA